MVFESIVVDVLNRFLGDYVENLNRNQLKLGIWGGDVVLENLVLKQNALEELNIPVQTVYGHLGRLVLKIPWKNLYGASVEATIEGLLLVVNPNAEVKYDAEKEEKYELASKQAELARIEEAKKREAQKDENKLDETFVEKLVTQIIKNVQLKITDIHVRYEDSITNPKAPFSFGITLHNLSVHTTDENWQKAIILSGINKIFKICSLEGLALYWNTPTELYSKFAPNIIKEKLINEIATKSSKPTFYKYPLGPINAMAKLKLNTKPELDTPRFSTPKVILSLHMEQLSVSLTKPQYQDMMLLADSMDRMNKGAPYRKYRPDVNTYRGYYKKWWKFAYQCIVEEEVRRKQRNWDWNHIHQHRKLCKDYEKAYGNKLVHQGKISSDQLKIIDHAEKTLDLLNLVIIRQRAEMEIERMGKLQEKKAKGWFSGWWGGSAAKDESPTSQGDLIKQFQIAMTSEEKEKLFRAIDYQENTAPTFLPLEYVATECHFQLDRLQMTVMEQDTPVLTAIVDIVMLEMRQRPSANAIRLDVDMHTFTVSGVQQGDFLPDLVISKHVTKESDLLNVMFETNPLDNSCDQRVQLLARPLQIVYDAQTVIQLVEVFKPPVESSALETLQAAAENKFSDLKEKSALGMQYVVQQHQFIDLDIQIAASYIIIPQTGMYTGKEQCAVINLGAISVKSAERSKKLDIAQMYRDGMDEETVHREIVHHSYDMISLGLTEIQIVVAKLDEDWKTAILSHEGTPLHLLQPTNFNIQIYKCLIVDDPRLPKIKIIGELEKIAVSVSQDRLLTLCEILISMPMPKSEERQLKASESKSSSLSLLKYLDPMEKQKREEQREKNKKDEQMIQLTEVEAFFVMKELILSVNRKTFNPETGYDKFLMFSLRSFELTVSQKTFNLEAMIRLEAVQLSHYRKGFNVLHIIDQDHKTSVTKYPKLMSQDDVIKGSPTQSLDEAARPLLEDPEIDKKTPRSTQKDAAANKIALSSHMSLIKSKGELEHQEYLFCITYCNVDKKCPDFRSKYGSVEQDIELDFTNLKITLHLQSLQEILVVVNEYQTRLQDLQNTVDRMANAGPLETIIEEEGAPANVSLTNFKFAAKPKQVETIQMKMIAYLGTIGIEFSTDARKLSLIQLTGASAGVVIKASYMSVELNVSSISVKDLNPVTLHTEILKVVGGDVIHIQVVMYNDGYPSPDDVNMSIDAQLNQLRIIFINWYINSMLEFLNNFQDAQVAIIEASTQAADAARVSAQTAYENSTKLSLKIRLAAPIILVPENSKSMNVMFVDLGRITLQNHFVDIGGLDTKKKVTVDELTLELEDMKMSCANLERNTYEYKTERKLLRPTSFKLFVKRSLSPWYDKLPDLDVFGRIQSVVIQVGHSDFQSIMKILNQNLQEGQKVVKTQPEVPKTKVNSKSQQKVRSTFTVHTESSPEFAKAQAKVLRTTMKFSFTMDSFVINLLSAGKGSGEGGVSREVDLARFCMALLSVKGSMYSDNSMHTSVLLVDCTVDDTRPCRGARITRYLERHRRKDESANEQVMMSHDQIRSMIDITYTLKNNDAFVDLRIFSFNLILAMDFMNKILEFMALGGQDTESTETALPTTVSKKKVAPSAMTVEKVDLNKEKDELPKKQPMMTVNIKIEQPDIILVESLEHKQCDALVLNMEVRFKLRQTSERMVADGGISGLQMVVRTIGSDRRTETPRYLLSPAYMSLALSQPPDSGMHVDIAVSDIKITVSPDIITLLSRVLTTVTATEESANEDVNKIYHYNNLWAIQPFKSKEYWFLRTENAEEATEDVVTAVAPVKPPVGEICLLSSPSIVVSFEMEIGNETIPVLVMQASLTGQLKDWSSELYLESTWAMQLSYYNIARAVWEPLVEPVERMRDCSYKHEPWELKMEVVMRTPETLAIDATDEAANLLHVAQRQANKTVTLSSSDTLEITFTNTGIEVLTQLSNSFFAATVTDATSSKTKLDKQKNKFRGAPYVLHNCTGLSAKLTLVDNKDFTVFLTQEQEGTDYREVVLEPGASVPLQLRHGGLGKLKLNVAPPPLRLRVKIVELDDELVIPVERADKRYFTIGTFYKMKSAEKPLHVPHVAATEPRGLISDVVMQDAAVNIYLRSVVQVTNSLSVNVSVYFMTTSGNEVRLLGEVKPGDVLRLPLQAVHTPTAEIFFSVEGFTVSVSPFIWRELQQEPKISKLLQCDCKDKKSGEKFYIRALGTMEQVFFEATNKYTFASSCYDIVLKPAVKMQNCLPVPIVVSQLGLKRTQIFQPGEMFHLSHLAPYRASMVVMIQNYLDKCWVCTKNLPNDEMELSVWSFDSHDSPIVMTLDLGMHSRDQEGTQVLSLYCPFWMLNKTGFTLSYRSCDETGNVIFHPKDYREPILFSFRAKNFFGKKKASIRIDFGEWSDKFPLDVPGSSGVINCRLEGRVYKVAATNQLTFNSLTKMVVFTPFFLIINEAPFNIQYQEMHRSADPWLTVEKNSSAPLWPVIEKEDKLLLVRVEGSSEICAPFLYTEQHSTCLKLDNSYGGLFVDVDINEGGTYITVQQYKDGHAPALLVNYTQHEVTVYEKENVNTKTLPKMHKMLYAWDNPAGPQRLVFDAYKKEEIEDDLRQDGIGKFRLNQNVTVFWVSFLNGLQRVILFTTDAILASGAHNVGEAEAVDTEMILSMQGMGLSLVNDLEMHEIVYMSISNSGIIWEQCKVGGRRYKKIEGTKLIQYEEAYQKYITEKMVSDEPVNPVVTIDEKIVVDFEQMRALKPSTRILRRTLEPGLWASYGMTAHSVRIHARLHRLQIDQQLPLPTFPVVLAPVPPPKSVANEGQSNIMKPFLEVSIVERTMEHSKVRQFKYYKVLIQEFHIKVDMGLINAMMAMFPQKVLNEQEALEAFLEDLKLANQPLAALAAREMSGDQKNFYDNLHLSPLKVHVSFSIGGATQLPSFVGTILQSIGVTLTDMNDVVFKLSYYERSYEFMSQKELISEVQSHYMGQALKQLYVLVLGLDVIGNPYGLVIGLKKGVEDLFYEPFQGAIQGPTEFAEGLFLGVRSLVGHTVGGAAGAVSRITGAMGHGLAALSLDKDYQRRRRDNMNKPPANLQEGLARSGKGLVMGVVDGVTGVFTKPIEGARDQGFEGFFKGLGKGAVGLVARPTAGVVDFASGSLNAVKRAADFSDEVTKRRPARYLPPESGVRPYSRLHAEGYKMLFELEKGKFVETDSYEAHVWVVPYKEVVLCTDKRILYLEKNQVFGGWQILWTFLWSEIPEMPTIVNKGVFIPMVKKKVLGMFPSRGAGKLIFLYDDQQRKYLLAQCEKLMSG